jgi:hypothetical protein
MFDQLMLKLNKMVGDMQIENLNNNVYDNKQDCMNQDQYYNQFQALLEEMKNKVKENLKN